MHFTKALFKLLLFFADHLTICFASGPKKENDWGPGGGGGGAGGNNGWGDPRSTDPRQPGMDHREIRTDLRSTNNSETLRLLDHREQMRQMASSDMRGDPRGK